ncbi:MAG: 2-dehydropantoate 2-reductase [Sporichthyaceae bacterium]
MRVAVFGAGGVGGYLAAKLGAAGGCEVAVVARGAHLDAIRSDGLHLSSVDGDAHARVAAEDDTAKIGPVDVVLFTVKTPQGAAALEALPALLGPDTVVVTLQNGVDGPGIVSRVVPAERVLPGLVYVVSSIEAPGRIFHPTVPARFFVGESDGRDTGRAKDVGELLVGAGIDVTVSPAIEVEVWRKFVLIAAMAGATAGARAQVADLWADAPTAAVVEALATEAAAVGRATGVDLPDDLVPTVLAMLRTIAPGSTSSLHRDLEAGRPSELDSLSGAIARLGAEHGVPTPVTSTVYGLLLAWERRNAYA